MKKLIVSILVIGLLLTTSIASVNAFEKGELLREWEFSGSSIPYADMLMGFDGTNKTVKR